MPNWQPKPGTMAFLYCQPTRGPSCPIGLVSGQTLQQAREDFHTQFQIQEPKKIITKIKGNHHNDHTKIESSHTHARIHWRQWSVRHSAVAPSGSWQCEAEVERAQPALDAAGAARGPGSHGGEGGGRRSAWPWRP
jgi:hypothetical protein